MPGVETELFIAPAIPAVLPLTIRSSLAARRSTASGNGCEGGLYDSDMGRHGTRADMIVHEEQPFNAERGLAALAEPLTATNAFYVRGHGDVPGIDPLWEPSAALWCCHRTQPDELAAVELADDLTCSRYGHHRWH